MAYAMEYKVPAVFLLLWLSLSLLLEIRAANDRIAGGSNWPATPYRPGDVSPDELVLMSHMDGTIRRLGPRSEELWSFFSGSPLSSASYFYSDPDEATLAKTSVEFDGVIDEGGSQVIRFSVMNHSFCVYNKENDEEVAILTSVEDDILKRTPIAIMTWDEVINRTPQLTVDGRVVVGSRSTTVFYLDGATGTLIRKFEAATDTLSDLGAKLAEQNMTPFIGDVVQEPLFIVRTDYAVQSLDRETGIVRWNVSMGTFRILTPQGNDVSEMPTLAADLAVRPLFDIKPFSGSPRPTNYDAGSLIKTLPLPGSKQDLPALPSVSAVEPKSPPTPDTDGLYWTSKLAYLMGVAFSIIIGLVVLSLSLGKPLVETYFGKKSKPQVNMGSGGRRKKNKKHGGSNGSSTGSPGKPVMGEAGFTSAAGEARISGSSMPELPSKKNRRKDSVDEGDGVRVGRLFVSSTIIGYGSHGTIVVEGSLDGRNVAIKRLLVQFHEKARKEIAALIETDEHPNVVRCFAMEEDEDFVYLALERCTWSLNDLIINTFGGNVPDTGGTMSPNIPLVEKSHLWKSGDQPSLLLLQLMRDVVAGLAHLHSRNIVHRDLKPRNVLVVHTNARACRAKLSDMGISKRIDADSSSFDPHTGVGSSGWQAPEQLRHGRQTRSVDMFSLGCVLYFCITGGQHPFGSQFERDRNILHDQFDIFLIQHLPEASHLIRALISHDPKLRPLAQEVQVHPFFWTAEERLLFLTGASDRVELEDREDNSTVLEAMEAVGATALSGCWDEKLDSALIENLGKYRRYNYLSVRDLLRVIRNKSNHYRELPQNVKDLLGPHPEGYVSYFTTKFPHLIIEVYKVLGQNCRDEPVFHKFFFCDQQL